MITKFLIYNGEANGPICRVRRNRNGLRAVDEIFRSTLESITNSKVKGVSWEQASLTMSFDGLGVKKVEALAIPAYLTPVHCSSELSNRILEKFNLDIIDNQIFQLINVIAPESVPVDELSKHEQKNWDIPQIQSKFNAIFNSGDPTTRARLLASSTKESSKWLQVIPSSQLGLLLDNNKVLVFSQ